MNERIRKLALETDVWCDQNWAGHEFYNIRWEEKFAELIVRECTNMLPEDSIRDANGVHMFYVIRKHFGVE
jgi:hypothetical protein